MQALPIASGVGRDIKPNQILGFRREPAYPCHRSDNARCLVQLYILNFVHPESGLLVLRRGLIFVIIWVFALSLSHIRQYASKTFIARHDTKIFPKSKHEQISFAIRRTPISRLKPTLTSHQPSLHSDGLLMLQLIAISGRLSECRGTKDFSRPATCHRNSPITAYRVNPKRPLVETPKQAWLRPGPCRRTSDL